MRRFPYRRASPAFTLVELLVTIAIIAIVASLLFPAASRAKYSAKNTACRNNLRQIHLAVQLYTSTHEQFPSYGRATGPEWHFWYEELELPLTYEPFVIRPDLPLWQRLAGAYHCPLLQSLQAAVDLPDGPAPAVKLPVSPSYGYNAWGVGDPFGDPAASLGLGGTPFSLPEFPTTRFLRNVRESDVRAPTDMLALGDSFCRSRQPTYDGAISLDPLLVVSVSNVLPVSLASDAKKQPDFTAHRAQANRAFVDGHLESEDMRKTFEARDDQLARWNIDNQPHSDLLSDLVN